MKQPSLRPADIVTALQISLSPTAGLSELSERSAKSIGETHNAIRRLTFARLLMPERRTVAVDALVQFIRWGVPFAYPAVLGGPAVGYPTASLQADPGGTGGGGEVSGGHNLIRVEFVWPSADGPATGTALIPLFAAAPRLVARNPQLAAMVSLVDLVRVGGSRERDAAIEALAAVLRPPSV